MEIKKIKKEEKTPINSQLRDLAKIKISLKETLKDYEKITEDIRNGFEEVVVVFIDLVNSTKFKIDNQEEPEVWISRIKLFSEILKEFIQDCNGKVVKYIGDEVMAIFDRESQIKDAINFINRIKDIEETITEITEAKSKVKIAIDYGKVFLLEYDGHKEYDPQGIPIDRCARIAKHCEPSTILTSYEFVSHTEFPDHWKKIGDCDFKGLGQTDVYQYGEKTVKIEPMIEIPKSTYDQITQDLKDGNLTITQLKSMNKKLAEKVAEYKKDVDKELVFKEDSKENEKDELWEEIEDQIKKLNNLIHNSDVSDNEYARFLFLHMRGDVEKYNVFENKVFDRSIEENIVVETSDEGYYKLNSSHRRNAKIIEILDKLQANLESYEYKFRSKTGSDDKDLFDYDLSEASFWEKYIGYNVRFF